MSEEEANREELVRLDQLAEQLSGLDPAFLTAALRAGLFGPFGEAGVPRVGVEHFSKYGTQWRSILGARQLPTDRLPVPPGVGGEQPVGTVTQLQITGARENGFDTSADRGWIAQYYIRPNPWCWAPATESALIGPVPVKLAQKSPVPGVKLLTYLCPDPDGRFAMVMVFGTGRAEDDGVDAAYDIVHPVLGEMAFRADVPLPIAHALHIGVPSGTVTLELAKPPKTADLTGLRLLRPDMQPDELLAAKALYWEGVSSTNPFHQFLTFWRVYENVVVERSEWRKRERRPTVELHRERLPDTWAWRTMKGKTFEKARQELRDSHRNAVAHANRQKGPVLSPATATERNQVATKIPIVRYMARVVLQNFEATLMGNSEADVAQDPVGLPQ